MKKLLGLFFLATLVNGFSQGVAVRRDEVSALVATNANLANRIYVSALDGDNTTGQRANASRPFLTIAAAQLVAQPGDVITVRRGQYVEDLLGAEGVTYELATDALVGDLSLTGPIFRAQAIAFRIQGSGFIRASGAALDTRDGGSILLNGVHLKPNTITNNVSGTWYSEQ